MKKREFWKIFFGAMIGFIVYKTLVNNIDPFESYWANYITDVLLIAICCFAGIVLLNLAMKQFSSEKDG
ncbi:MAG: hypothetical protein R3283_07200 [Balneolaceae bacterium]|nr:hypothetical protein [Balneolaceae bacterium]